MRKRIAAVIALLCGVLMYVGMYIGYRLAKQHGTIVFTAPSTRIDTIIRIIAAKYMDSVDMQELADATIHTLLAQLDPHTRYIPARETQEAEIALTGTYEGIGIEFIIMNDTPMVTTPIAGGPAEAVGMRAGDRIVKVEDSVVAGVGISALQVVKMLRGPRGTKVRVTVVRPGVSEPLEFVIVREKIGIASVEAAFLLADTVGYIRISRFISSTPEEVRAALQQLLSTGMKALIVDLRNNPGGFITAAIEVADEFLPGDSLIVYTQGRAYPRQEYRAGREGLYEGGPLAVLIDGSSASASEIVAAALQDNHRAIIVGTPSFGKGLVQEEFDLPDGSILLLSVARYYTPSGRSLQRPYVGGEFLSGDTAHSWGVHPDVKVGGKHPGVAVSSLVMKLQARGVLLESAYNYASAERERLLEMFPEAERFVELFVPPASLLERVRTFALTAGLLSNGDSEWYGAVGEIRRLLKAYVARSLYGDVAYYRVLAEDDPYIEAALDALAGRGTF